MIFGDTEIGHEVENLKKSSKIKTTRGRLTCHWKITIKEAIT